MPADAGRHGGAGWNRRWMPDDASTSIALVQMLIGRSAAPTTAPRDILTEARTTFRAMAEAQRPDAQLGFARAVISDVIRAYWTILRRGDRDPWLPAVEQLTVLDLPPLSDAAAQLACGVGTAAAGLDVPEAAYLIGVLYTSMMPGKIRSAAGAYYTPPALCERLLDMASEAGVDWGTARVLDPACGGGAFLSPVARRMTEHWKDRGAEATLASVIDRLRGFEIDPFAAWLSQVFLEATLWPLCAEAGIRLPMMVEVCDSLSKDPTDEIYDLVVGNPPYGRITLSPEMRVKYKRSLYGHANLYGLFTDLALRLAKPGGTIAYVTPTSFLAGEYYKALRGVLAKEAPPVSIDFVSERKGVFADVLQEAVLTIYRRGGQSQPGYVHFLSSTAQGEVHATLAGAFNLPDIPDQPWLLPRASGDSALIHAAEAMPCRLVDYGYKVSTGPLVWNRHKASLRDDYAKSRYPLIWAEAVRPDGRFEFRALKRGHKPFFEPAAGERWVVTGFPCVLLQRTTAKEQNRRLIAAELPQAFLDRYGAVVVENHLNMIRPLEQTVAVDPDVVATLLNTAVVDQLFRCINGSVAVSAYELEALPLPSPASLGPLTALLREGASREAIESEVAALYGQRNA